MPPDLDAVCAGAVTLYRCGDDFDLTKPRECSCDADPEHGPHRNDGDEIAPWPYMALPAPQFTALLDALAAARDALRFYADASIYDRPALGQDDMGRTRCGMSKADDDDGAKARAALAKIGGAAREGAK